MEFLFQAGALSGIERAPMLNQRLGSHVIGWRMRSRIADDLDETIFIVVSIFFVMLAAAILTLF
jgi:hypothetical protein